ncbi:DUF4349 domain-containing protein [Andreprevotia chitinilytica]|uniref:DUF4349 domain-containing protein n=1 Tax=Andreprevotia chitinilytica TaxID=396808 RepID=UPI00068A9DC6|nr:DUF4349 domain-containing protein [Andreprevotia chitinilytica]
MTPRLSTYLSIPVAPLLALVLLTGCGKREEPQAALSAPAAAPSGAVAEKSAAADTAEAAANAPRRYIAVRQHLTIETEPEQLSTVWQAAQQRCVEPTCELLNATLNKADDYGVPTAQISVRLKPSAVAAYTTAISQNGKVIEQAISREDKTDEVIDVEARQKNIAQLRDNLRQMLNQQNAKLADLLAVQKELAEAQSQLDSMAGRRLALANQTDKVAVDIELRARRSVAERSVFAPLMQSWHEVGYRFMENVGNVLTFVASILPWLLLLWLPGWWLIKRWRNWRAKRRASKEKQA